MSEAPNWTPQHREPRWISEGDVEEMLTKVGEQGGHKPTLWDCLMALRAVVNEKGK